MDSSQKNCEGCNCSIDMDNTIIIDNKKLCVDCAKNILTHDDTLDIISQHLSPMELINLKRTLKGFSPNINNLISNSIEKYKINIFNKNIRNGSAQFYNFLGDNYPSFRLENINSSEDGEDIEENLEFFRINFSSNIMKEYLDGEYDFFDSDGDDYATFEELLYAELGLDDPSKIKEIIEFLNTGGKQDGIDQYTIFEIKKLILNNLVLHFEPEKEDFYMYKVSKKIQNNMDYMVGDIFYAQDYITSRPQYGLGIIGWDWKNNKKIPLTDGEGQPILPQNILDKLKENKVTYVDANLNAIQELFSGEFDDEDIWILLPQLQSL